MNKPIQTRFWSKVNKRGIDDCWEWTAHKNPSGYGTFRDTHGCTLAHRMAWKLTFGAIPKGQPVLHDCPNGDNPACCNPNHLWLGTVADNNRDRHAKGRTACGTGIGRAKLTDQLVVKIRTDYFDRGIPQKDIAKWYGVRPETISKIINRLLWKHV